MKISRSERFWKKVSISEPYKCWIWKGATNRGYGSFRWDGTTTIIASRAAYKLVYGITDDRALVLHRCNNKLCVNPTHLYLGDYIDNARDLLATGYKRSTKLQSGEIWLVIKLCFSGYCLTGRLPYFYIGRMFRVNEGTIRNMVKRYQIA